MVFFSLGVFLILLGVLMINNVSAIKADFYYSTNCPHCREIYPFVSEVSNYFDINFHDVNKEKVSVDSVPTVKIKTSDCRNIELIGSYEISKYLVCELQEMSTEKCMTHNYLKRGSYFIE